ncbi:MAG: hypothetical protein M1814_006941 [Vezdaea aestivalis]|nr:MAG: hypothetical protein M1814_006941 [Vezdaea aestivalis]
MAPPPPPSHFTLLYFALSTRYTHLAHEYLPAPTTLTQLLTLLDQKYPGLRENVLESALVTVNMEYVDKEGEGDVVIKEGDEVGIIPPVSSG